MLILKSIPAAIGLPKRMLIKVIFSQCCLTSVIKFKFESIHHGTASGCASVWVADNHFVKNWLQRIKNGCLKDSDENILERPDCKKRFCPTRTYRHQRRIDRFAIFEAFNHLASVRFNSVEVWLKLFSNNFDSMKTSRQTVRLQNVTLSIGTTLHTWNVCSWVMLQLAFWTVGDYFL